MKICYLDKLRKTLSKYPVKRICKFTLGCLIVVVLKIIITNLLLIANFSIDLSYLLCHVVIMFFSFYYHSTFTFVAQLKTFREKAKSFFFFMNSVLILKVIDYFVVVIGSGMLIGYLQKQTTLDKVNIQIVVSSCIFVTSGVIFILRYFIYKFIFIKKNDKSNELPVEDEMTDFDYYTGPVKRACCGFATDKELSENAASGGIVSGLIQSMLKEGTIDGALTYSFITENGEFKVKPGISVNKEDLLASQGSIYYSFPALNSETMKLIREFDGRLAIVGLPCNIRALREMIDRDEFLREKIVVLIGLFCGHTSRPALIENVLKQKQLAAKDIKRFRFRKGLWRGYVEAVTNSNQRSTWPTSLYSLYQNLFILSAPQCISCFDHYAEAADISVGDIWLLKHKDDPVKHSIFAARTDVGLSIIENAEKKGFIKLEDVDQNTLYKANIRAVIFHKAIAARSLVGRLYGLKVKVPQGAKKARLNEILAAVIAMGAYRFSISGKGHWLFKIPRLPLKILLYAFKGLTNF